jgi:hypothetical protein
MNAKELLLKVKAIFNGTTPVQPAPAPAPAPQPGAMTAKTYKLQDGTEINIAQAGELPAAGDMVTIAGAPAAANTYTLEDGAVIVVDATGMITTYTPAAPAPAPAPTPAPPQPVTLSEMTPEQVEAMYAKFATGTPEERLANLEVMIKALMETNYGWKIREGNENQAIQVYKDTMTPAAPAPSVTIEEMSSVFAKAEKADEQAQTITRLEETIKGLFELVERLVELPTGDPVTLTGTKKEKFERAQKKENAVLGIAAALKDIKKQN